MDFCYLADDLFTLIKKELIQAQSQEDVAETYPKLVLSVEFFRYIRGEFFHASRPSPIECQDKIYKMERELLDLLQALKTKIDKSDQRTKYYLDQNKELFD